jgi:glycosyltransferase involved in cell wall biosynthesis
MKVAWIFPQKKMCGISFYSHAYVEALRPSVEVVCLDPDDFASRPAQTSGACNRCELVHIQYETSFFLKKNRDFYPDICSSIKRPLVVTLHEVYDQFPGVFPRDALTGPWPVLKMRQWLYDWRHPYVTALAKHTHLKFYSRVLIVHSRFQRDILARKGVSPDLVSVFPVPVGSNEPKAARPWNGNGPLNLAATGFVSDSYDYELLFDTLALCEFPWRFTWIGGVRRPDDRRVLEKIQREIDRKGWRDRFSVTGALSDAQRDELLGAAHVYCAFFKYKSSSESLATAIGGGTLVVATDMRLTREMSAQFPVMVITRPEPSEAAEAIRRVADDKALQESLRQALKDYCHEYSRERMARRLVSFYEKEIVG